MSPGVRNGFGVKDSSLALPGLCYGFLTKADQADFSVALHFPLWSLSLCPLAQGQQRAPPFFPSSFTSLSLKPLWRNDQASVLTLPHEPLTAASHLCLVSIKLNLWSDLVLASKQPRVRNTVWEEMVKTILSLALRRPDLYLLKNCRLKDLAKSNNSCSFLRVTESENPKEKSEFFPCWRSWLMARHRRPSGVVMKGKWVWTGWLNKWCSTAGSFPILLRNHLSISMWHVSIYI